MPHAIERRREPEIAAEQTFLQRRVAEIEKSLGAVAARAGSPTPISQPIDALDRAREITNDMYRQVRVRTLEEAIEAQLQWLDRAEARLELDDGEPKVGYNRIALDRRLLTDLRRAWLSARN